MELKALLQDEDLMQDGEAMDRVEMKERLCRQGIFEVDESGMDGLWTREMKSEAEMMHQGGMYHFKHQVSPIIPRSFNNLPDARNGRDRLSISSPKIELRREWEEPMTFVMAAPRLALGGGQ